MHVLEHVLARSFKESARASATATPSSQDPDWSPALHILLSPTTTTTPPFSDIVDEHSHHRAPLSRSHLCKNRPHDATNARTTHPAFFGPSRDRLQAQLYHPHPTQATVAALRNGDVIGKSNQ
jgi:hypothetical protein